MKTILKKGQLILTNIYHAIQLSSLPWLFKQSVLINTRPNKTHQKEQKGCPRGVMVKAMNCGIVVREFVLQSRYYVHFRANTLGKGMNPLILPPTMGK